MRAMLTTVAAVALVAGLATPAAAGGAVWQLDRRYHRPGEVATAHTSVAWDHNPSLGRPADGPYYLYLASGDCEGPCPRIERILLGVVEVREGAYAGDDGELYGPNWAGVSFVVPDVAPGRYALEHCNDPCTTKLGDITWGELRVLSGVAAPAWRFVRPGPAPRLR